MNNSIIGEYNEIKDHSFLASELLAPNINKADANRSFMFTSHINQFIHLDNPEPPKIFSNFENQVAQYNSTNIVAETDYVVDRVFYRNKFNGVAFLREKSKKKNGRLKLIEITPYSRFTEYFAGQIHQYIPSEGELIEKDTFIQHSNLTDDNGNLQYGTNLKSVFLAWDNLTYEDACVISKSAAEKKLSSTLVDEISISINTNNIPLNIYGSKTGFYKVMPDVGDDIEGSIVMALRQLNYTSFLYDMSDENLKKINYLDDTVFYADGKVFDIEVFSNTDIDKLDENLFNKQFIRILNEQTKYYQSIIDYLKPIVDEGLIQLSDDMVSLYCKAQKILEGKKWEVSKTQFENLTVVIRVAHTIPMHVGDKLTGR